MRLGKFDLADNDSKPTGGKSTVARQAQARAHDPATVSDMMVLEFIGRELAVTTSAVVNNFSFSEDQAKSRLQSLVSQSLLRVQGVDDSQSGVYSLTQAGAETLERTMKRGLSAYF